MPESERTKEICDPRTSATRYLTLALILVFAIDLAVIQIFWSNLNPDLIRDVIPWYNFILERGKFWAFGESFYNYTPPYLYLLSLGTLAHRLLDPATVIRAISLGFDGIAALLVFYFARQCAWPRRKSILLAAIFFALPELVVNSGVWGQCDIIYTLFLIAFVLFVPQGSSTLATTMLGIAFTFKLQTIFIGPFVLYLLLVRRLRLRDLAMVPLVYIVLMIPSALAGRSWGDLLTIYVRQIDTLHLLSVGAPNPYFVIRMLVPDSYDIGMTVGLLVATVSALALVVAFVRREQERSPERFLLMATLTLAVMPYVLPKMHERYFFPAGAMAFLLTVVRPRTWPIVVLIQAADLCGYTWFLLDASGFWVELGAVFMTCAIGLLIWMFLQKPSASGCASSDVSAFRVHSQHLKPGA